MDVAITPSATSSKVLVSFNCGGYSVLDNQAIMIRIKRDTTVVRECGRWAYQRNDDYTSLPISITYLGFTKHNLRSYIHNRNDM